MERFVPYRLEQKELGKATVKLTPARMAEATAEPVEVDVADLLAAFRRKSGAWSVAEAKNGLPFGPDKAFVRDGLEYYPDDTTTAAEAIVAAMLRFGRPFGRLYYLTSGTLGTDSASYF